MSFSNAPSLQGTVIMEISKNGSVMSNDLIQVAGTLTYGGALVVSNLGPTALANGDKFQLFNAAGFAGAFSSLDLPPLGSGLSWKINLLVDGSLEVFAPPAIPLSRGSYSQNFDSLGTSNALWLDNSTLPGWYAQSSAMPHSYSYTASDGSDVTGGLYSFGSTGSSDRALGSIASISVGNISYGLCFTNDTANSVSNFIVSYTGEQWRCAGSSSITNFLTFWYRISPSVITNPEPDVVTGWTQVSNLNFASPTVLTTTTSLDGNNPSNRRVLSSVLIPGLVVPPGEHVFFRWRDTDDPGADQAMALDDLTISFAPVAPQISSVTVNPANGFVQIAGQGESNKTYSLQATTNLTPPIFWQVLGSNTANANGIYQFTDTNAPAFTVRFYRIVSP